jgi:hypothetical protein
MDEPLDRSPERQDWSEALWGVGLLGSVLVIVSLIALTYR